MALRRFIRSSAAYISFLDEFNDEFNNDYDDYDDYDYIGNSLIQRSSMLYSLGKRSP